MSAMKSKLEPKYAVLEHDHGLLTRQDVVRRAARLFCRLAAARRYAKRWGMVVLPLPAPAEGVCADKEDKEECEGLDVGEVDAYYTSVVADLYKLGDAPGVVIWIPDGKDENS